MFAPGPSSISRFGRHPRAARRPIGVWLSRFALVAFVAVVFRRARATRRGLVWLITAASYLLWLNTGSIMARC